MAKIWRNRIEAGTKTFAECPARYHKDVLAIMRRDVENGIITAEEFKELTGQDY